MKKIIFLASVLSMLLIGNFANAQSRGNTQGKNKAYAYNGKHKNKMNISQRQHHQHMRIKQGVRNGSLTRNEARHLRMQQFRVNDYKRMAKADGHVSKKERKLIARTQSRAGRDIAYMKHNNRMRYRR